MTCREVADFLAEYLAGGVVDASRAEFERHLLLCPPCVRYLNTYKKTIEVGKSVYESCGPEHVEEIPEDLVQAILAAHERGRAADLRSSQ